MSEYDNRGKVSIWKSDIDHPDAPVAVGKVVAHRNIQEGETVRIALWKNDSDHPKAPVMTGKISDPRQQQEQQPAAPATPPPPAGGFKDDDIPF